MLKQTSTIEAKTTKNEKNITLPNERKDFQTE